MKCEYCGIEISPEKIKKASKCVSGLVRLKYCSDICNKRRWHYKNSPLKKNYRETATYVGKKWEDYASNKLGVESLNKDKFNNPGYDILFKDNRIDVKSKNTFKKYDEWTFSRENKKTDFYLCFCLKKNKLVKTYFIKETNFGKSGITIGKKSKKFDKYLIDFYEDTKQKTIFRRIQDICKI